METDRPFDDDLIDYDEDGPLDLRKVDARSVNVGQTFDAGEGRIFPCDSCGADLVFHIGQQKLSCEYCGHVKEIVIAADATLEEQDFHAMLERVTEWRQEEAAERPEGDDDSPAVSAGQRELRCDSCGGNVEFVGTITSTHCPYCASPMQLETAHKSEERRIPVDGILPFQVEHEHARENLQQWVDSRWFAPNDFRKRGADGKFNGIYLSYFTFDAMTFTAYRGRRGDYYYVTVGSGKNRRRQRRTRWSPAHGRFQRFFDDVLVLANTGLRRDFMQSLEPWPLLKVVPFNQQMMAGYLARTYDVELDVCFGEAKQRIDHALNNEVRLRIGGDTQQINSINTQYDAITFKHLLLPTWLLAYPYRGRTYQVFINAATGEVQGERPWSVWKILFAVMAALAVVGGLIWANGGVQLQ